jgi:glycosyltransferase involved in cell wall biosynthesis
MNDPKLSVITPSYEQGRFLEDCIMSVKTQPLQDVEHIVVDGGSDDETIDILQRHENDYNLRWISEPDRGQSHAINKGIEMASGEWIGWQNSDDYYLPGAFDILDRELPSDVELVYGDTIVVDEHKRTETRLHQTRPSKFIHRYWSLFARNHSSFIRADFMEELGGVAEEYEIIMDEDLYWRVLQSDPVVQRVDRAVGAFRVHQDAKTYAGYEKQRNQERQRLYPTKGGYLSKIHRSYAKKIGRMIKYLYILADGRWEAIARQLINDS